MSGHLYLIGFMASGKSTVGPLLAEKMGRTFHDLDDRIEADESHPISEIFESRGEDYFRALESKILKGTVNLPAAVLALGGGAFVSESNREFIRRTGVSVWLEISLDLALKRCREMTHRPLARDPVRFEHLYRSREQVYRQADIHIEAEEKSPQEICRQILAELAGSD